MKKLIIFFVLIFQCGYSQNSDYKKDALKLYELSGAFATIQYAKTTISKVIPLDKQALFQKDFEELFMKTNKNPTQ